MKPRNRKITVLGLLDSGELNESIKNLNTINYEKNDTKASIHH